MKTITANVYSSSYRLQPLEGLLKFNKNGLTVAFSLACLEVYFYMKEDLLAKGFLIPIFSTSRILQVINVLFVSELI